MELREVYNVKIFEQIIGLLYQEYGDDDYSEKRRCDELNALISKDIILCCYYDKDKIVGHISYRKPEKEDFCCSIVSVFVNKEFRGHGYGKQMLLSFEKYICTKKLSRILLGARRGREGFYYSCGYEGEALVQANKNDMTKEEMENMLLECSIPTDNYVFRNEEIHQFYFDAKSALNNNNLISVVDNSNRKIGLVIVFSKNI